jgi:LCP family protein required for cell wall assembly
LTGSHSNKPNRLRRAFARHQPLRAQSRAKAFTGLFFKFLALVLSSAVVIAGVSAWQIANEFNSNGIQLLDANGKAIQISAADIKGPINILLVGSDTRKGQGGGFGSGITSNLADVIILLHISQDRKNAVALSFPRDLMVPWPACPSTSGGSGYLPQSLGQINATIANGGPGCTLKTVESSTGLKIPFLAMINFSGVIEMSNAIGGVSVCLAKPINDTYTHTFLPAGEQVLQGRAALQFLRTRHGVGDGSDLSRISNQQVFLSSLVRKIKSQGVLSNPVYLYTLATAAARNMTLSSTMSDPNTLIALAGALKDVSLDKMVFMQLPSISGLPAPYQGRVKPNDSLAPLIYQKLQNDEPIVLSKANGGQGAIVQPSATPSPTASPKALSNTTANQTSQAKPAALVTLKTSATPSPTPLPDSIIGSHASDKTCSN